MQACVLPLALFYSAYARKKILPSRRKVVFSTFSQVFPDSDTLSGRLSMTGLAFFKIGLKGL